MAEIKQELEVKSQEAKARLRSQDDQDKELAALRREIDMKNISINLHDKKMRSIKDDNTKIRMTQLNGRAGH